MPWVWIAIGCVLFGCDRAPDTGFRRGAPTDDLPEWISPLLESGLRPDGSPDGTRLAHLDALVGQVHELEIATGERRHLTDHFDHRGFTRARYLSSGDLLLCGPIEAPAEDGSDERWASEPFFPPRGGEHPAQPLGEPCFEGPAVSRSWGYVEAEGVFPDGRSIAVEREPGTFTALPVGDLDIWRLPLDGSGRATRLTRFSEYAGYGANNPVISPDGSKMAFGLRIKGGEHGNARGVLLYDFEKAPHDVEEAPGSQEEGP